MKCWPYPEGSFNPRTFREIKEGEIFYGVWRKDGEIEKFVKGDPSRKGFCKADMWCELISERRAFTNYFLALTYSFTIKKRRNKEKLRNDKQKSHKALP
jgi:hypothetical protein